ncbi:MAG: hypothetical protein ACLUTF_03465 [Anaerostipes hadrus]
MNKRSLASQPTLSRFINRCDEICLYQFELIHQKLREQNLFMEKTRSSFDRY